MNRTVYRTRVTAIVAAFTALLLATEISSAQSGLETLPGMQKANPGGSGTTMAPTINPTQPKAVKAWAVYEAEAGPLTLLNCSGKPINVNTYNSNDTVLLIPYQTRSIGHDRDSRLACATSSCKLQISTLKTGALSGYRVFIRDKVVATNKASIARGCNVY
jgi:hypothetical protein